MARLRFDAVKGALNAALDTPTTTISSPGLARLGNVASPDTALICLYSTDAYGNIVFSENVYVVSHIANAVTATITRAGDGTSARSWPIGTNWTHGLGVADVADIEASSTSGVTAFNTRSGAVTLSKADVTGTGLTYSDVGADASGAATTVQNASLQKSSNLSDVASKPTSRSNLGLGSSAITTSAVLNALDYGVVADAYLGAGGSLASSTWTDSAGPFVAGSVGKAFWVEQLDGVWFRTTIATYISATQVTLTTTPASVDNQGVYLFGTDNSTAVTSLWSSAVTLANAGAAQPVYFPAGGYLFNTGIIVRDTLAKSNIQILGGGLQQTTFYPISTGTPGACITTSMTDTAYWYSGPVNISTPKIAPVLDFAINGDLCGAGDIGIDHGPGIGAIYRVYVANFDATPDSTYPTSGNTGGCGWRIRNLLVGSSQRYTEQTKFLAGCAIDKCFIGVEVDASTGTNSFEGMNFENMQVRITEPGARAFVVRGSGSTPALVYHSTLNFNGVVAPGTSSEAKTFFRQQMPTWNSTGARLAVSTAAGSTAYTANQVFSLPLSVNTGVSISAGTTILIGGVYFTSPTYQPVGSSSLNLFTSSASSSVAASTAVVIPWGLSGCPAIIGRTSGSVSGTVTSLPVSAGTNWRVQDGQIVNLVNPTTISATTVASSKTVTLASGSTATIWQGCSVYIPGAGASGGPLLTNVTKVLSSTTFQINTAASTVVTAASSTVNVQQAFMVYGNVASAATAVTTYSVTAGATFASGSYIELPPTAFVVGVPAGGVANTNADASRLTGSIVNWQVENSGAQATSVLAFISPFATMQYSGFVGSYLGNFPIVQAYGTFQVTAGTLKSGATAGLTESSSGIGIKGNATTPYDVYLPGGTTSGAPSSGTHSQFEIVPDATGLLWICTVAGTPGTWVAVDSTKAPLASPALTGNPTAPTQTAGDNSTKIATTAYADLKLAKASNLSDVANAATALSNLGGQPGTSQRSVFTTAGAYSGTAPSWANSATIYLVAGGGGGGGGVASTAAGGGGGGGAAGVVLARSIPVLPNTAFSGSVGAGGAGGAASANGTGGGNTTFVHNSQTYSATGGAYGAVGVSGGTAAAGLYGTAGPSGYVSLTMGSGGLGGSSTTTSNTVGPLAFGASGGAGGYPSSSTGTLGGKGGIGGSSTGGATNGGANSTVDGTAGAAGESSVNNATVTQLTKPGGGGGGGGGAAGTSGAAGAGGAGGTGSVVIVWQAS